MLSKSAEALEAEEGAAENGSGAVGEQQVVAGNSSKHPDVGTISDEANRAAVQMPSTRQEILDTGEEV